MAVGCGSKFRGLLREIEEQHEVELAAIWAEVSRLGGSPLKVSHSGSSTYGGSSTCDSLQPPPTPATPVRVESSAVWNDVPRFPTKAFVSAAADSVQPGPQVGQMRGSMRRLRVESHDSSVSAGPAALWPEWEGQTKRQMTSKQASTLSTQVLEQAHRRKQRTQEYLTDPRPEEANVRFVTAPTSASRAPWDITGVAFLMTDVVMIPMMVFNIPDVLWLRILDYSTLTYWTLDIVASFCVGYYDARGHLIMDPRKVAVRYFRSWFFPDVLILLASYMPHVEGAIENSQLEGAGSLRVFKFTRVARILRTLRLMRLMKLKNVMHAFQDKISSESVDIIAGLARNVLILVLINHNVACMWFYLGDQSWYADSWVNTYKFSNEPFGVQYLVSLHWSLTQFTPAGMQVNPTNILERTFNVVMILLAMVSFSTFVSSITASMTRLRTLKGNEVAQHFLLRSYLNDNGISRGLSMRIVRYVNLAIEMHRKKIDRSRVELLKLLSGPLNIELQMELFRPHLVVHRTLQQYDTFGASAMCDVCFYAVHKSSLSKGDVLFDLGVEAQSMFFVASGALVYARPRQANNVRDGARKTARVQKDMWSCEGVLWMPWFHRGSMLAMIESDVVALNSAAFRKVTLTHASVYVFARRCAEQFRKELQNTTKAVWDVTEDIMYPTSGRATPPSPHNYRLFVHHRDVVDAEEFDAALVGYSSEDSDDEWDYGFHMTAQTEGRVRFAPLEREGCTEPFEPFERCESAREAEHGMPPIRGKSPRSRRHRTLALGHTEAVVVTEAVHEVEHGTQPATQRSI